MKKATTIKQLIEKLQSFPPDIEVVVMGEKVSGLGGIITGYYPVDLEEVYQHRSLDDNSEYIILGATCGN